MPAHPQAEVQRASELCADHLDQIARIFKPGAKLTLLVRHPDDGDGAQDFVLTSDDIPEAINALKRRLTGPTVHGDV